MKTLTILTGAYARELYSFASEAASQGKLTYSRENKRDGFYRVYCAYNTTALMAEALLPLLEYIAMRENPIYRYSAKLRDFAAEHIRYESRPENTARLCRYLNCSHSLHLEGYITFRMAEYRAKLDAAVFSLIKKLKLTEL